MTEYIIRAALHDETNDGWVWTRKQVSRTVIRITNPANGRFVYCQAREIDDNFERQYNEKPRHNLTQHDTVVMSQWYRDALGGIKTTHPNNKTGRVELNIRPVGYLHKWWVPLRVAAHHPEIVVRIGVTLGVLGFGLGLVSLLPSMLEILAIPKPCQAPTILSASALALVLGYLCCRRPKFDL